ncbi:GNAT family N-acetyltransferase [Streptomyces palmae]|uniref:GNAT family N-acetyltransferase n=1 Tax=Streptomyces palmae TaxID=1701085 RepID=A0A4Z0FWP7_9ACTN|nr:GNAT family N-acetyltransferase [Streptomyces palmae]TGA86533.1 GNAT family N-acetyltransferase [Streptomyces palmae]
MTPPSYTYRPLARTDHSRLAALDSSFTTDTRYVVTATPAGFTVRPVPLDPPLTKHFPDEDDEPAEYTVVALEGDRVCGAIAVDYEAWNHRLAIRDIAVAPAHRGRGMGRGLMAQALAYGRSRGARTAWLEVTDLNAPAIRAYQRMGFTFCGLDTSLYIGTASEGETALFMSKALGDGAEDGDGDGQKA